jgi:hypothetical protein
MLAQNTASTGSRESAQPETVVSMARQEAMRPPASAAHASALAREAGSGSLGVQAMSGRAATHARACSPVPEAISRMRACSGRSPDSVCAIEALLRPALGDDRRAASAIRSSRAMGLDSRFDMQPR